MPRRPAPIRVGLISDTHGLLRPEALRALAGSDHIVHGGDIGTPEIVAQLATIAPVTAVRGNNDTAAWAAKIGATETLEAGGIRIFAIHDLAELDRDPAAQGIRVVVSGHSHIPRVLEEEGVLYVNPGSAGPRRFRLPVSVGMLSIRGADVTAEIVELAVAAATRGSPQR
ncbi:MAG TPA: metallophosphoesterase family protein [Usitatibacter sp.]|nr:metallophosphoesterase family protein [Usitatibacter sp.]